MPIPMCICRPFLSTSPMRSWLVSAVVDRSTLSTSGYFPIPALLSTFQAGRLAVKPVHGCMPSPISGGSSKPFIWSPTVQNLRDCKAPPREGKCISSTARAAITEVWAQYIAAGQYSCAILTIVAHA